VVFFGATPELGGSAALTRSNNTKAKDVIETKCGEFGGTYMEHPQEGCSRKAPRACRDRVAVDLGWERYIGLEGRFMGVGTASAPQAKSPKFKNRHQRRCGRER
jgi:hypothetical protein